MRKNWARLQRAVFLLGLLILWELAARFGPWPHFLFPTPVGVGRSLVGMTTDGRLFAAIARSLSRLGQGYLVSIVAGVPLGIFLGRIPFLQRAVKPVVLGLQALPSICWLPVAILWFGLSESAILFVVVMGSLLAIAIASEDAVNHIEPLLLRQAGTLGIKGARLYVGVLIPAALPGIITGLKLGWSFAWRALMAAELLFVSGGLGQLLHIGRELLDVAQVFAVMITIIVVGVAVDRLLFRFVEKRVWRRWGLSAAAR
ncbi:MAG: ABC transporter permease [Myxococcaceae bacterium]